MAKTDLKKYSIKLTYGQSAVHGVLRTVVGCIGEIISKLRSSYECLISLRKRISFPNLEKYCELESIMGKCFKLPCSTSIKSFSYIRSGPRAFISHIRSASNKMDKNLFIFCTEIFNSILVSFWLYVFLIAIAYLISCTLRVELFAYECGFAPFSETSYPFEVQFALILLIGIEVLYLYPLVIYNPRLSSDMWIMILGFLVCNILGSSIIPPSIYSFLLLLSLSLVTLKGIASHTFNSRIYMKLVAAPTFRYYSPSKNFLALLKCCVIFFIFYIFTSLDVIHEFSLAISLLSNKTLICPRLKYYHIFIRGVKGITPKNGSSTSKLPPISEKSKNNEDIPGNNEGQGIENQKLPLSEITKNLDNENPAIGAGALQCLPQKTGGYSASSSQQAAKKPLLSSSTEPKNFIPPVHDEKAVKQKIKDTVTTLFQEDIEKLGLSKTEITSSLLEKWKKNPDNFKEENIKGGIKEYLAPLHKKELEEMAKGFNIKNTENTKTTSPIFESKGEDPLKISLSQKLCEGASKIEGLTEFMKIKPNQLSSISDEMTAAHLALGLLIKQFCNDNFLELTSFINKENLQEYKKIYSGGSENLSLEQKYTHDAILGSLETLKTREQLQTNIDTLQKIKKSIDQDSLLTPKQLIEIAKKLGVVEYRDANYKGKFGDIYELIEHKQKEVGQLELKSRSLFEKTEKEDPDITRDQILTMIKEKNFQALDINIKDPKYEKLFLPSGVTGHTCIAINYKNKFLIVAYLTSQTDCPKICDSQLHNPKKTQHLYVLSNFCIEEINTTISNIKLKEYLDFSKTLDKIVEVIYDSQSFANALNSPTVETPITTFENVKQLVIEKADSLLITFQKSLKQYPMESPDVKEKEENKKIKFILDYLKNNLDDNSKQLLNWYLEMITHKKELTLRENQVINSLNKEKNKQIINIHE